MTPNQRQALAAYETAERLYQERLLDHEERPSGATRERLREAEDVLRIAAAGLSWAVNRGLVEA